MSVPLFKATAKANWLIGIIFLGVMFMYLSVIISMFDPSSAHTLNEMLKTMPKELISAMGFGEIGSDLTGFVASYYYGFIIIMFPMIYCIITANRLMAKHVDSGSMAYLLSTPNTRVRIAVTQAVYLLSTVTLLLCFVTVCGITVSASLFPGLLDIGAFLLLNFCTLLLFFALSGISFFFSCIFSETRKSLALGAGIPIAFFVLNILANVGEKTQWLKALTLLSLFKPSEIIGGNTFHVTPMIIFIGIAVASYIGGILIFNKRSLHL